ncbi:MAG: hypothetical protein K1X79_01870 [Oligoflexia bacterium]|nr:hypothetical protein [Oligoflexia bacterium]
MGTQTGERSIQGNVLGTDGLPLVGLPIQVIAPDTQAIIATVVTDANGQFGLAASEEELPDTAILKFGGDSAKTGSAIIDFNGQAELKLNAIVEEKEDSLNVVIVVDQPAPTSTPRAVETAKPAQKSPNNKEESSSVDPVVPQETPPSVAVPTETATPTPPPVYQQAPTGDDENEEGKKSGDPDPPPGENPIVIVPGI